MASLSNASDFWVGEPYCPECHGHFVPDPPLGAVLCECGVALEVEYRQDGWWRIRPIDVTIQGEVDGAKVAEGLGSFLAQQTGWAASEGSADDDPTKAR
jgi:hypothetical protein